jgi:hypothetical protein
VITGPWEFIGTRTTTQSRFKSIYIFTCLIQINNNTLQESLNECGGVTHNYKNGPIKDHISSGFREGFKCDLVSKYAVYINQLKEKCKLKYIIYNFFISIKIENLGRF